MATRANGRPGFSAAHHTPALWVTLRHFGWSEKTSPSGQVEVDEFVRLRGNTALPVDISELISVNALAPAGANRVKYATRAHELALITTYLTSLADDALALRADDFKSSSLHIKRFVSESLGLGMLTATVESLSRWNRGDGLFSFDALPVALARAFRKRGPRPDLLFDLGQERLAGEARGRSHAAPTEPRASQRERLTSLLSWSRTHGGHDVVMTWAYLTPKGVTVDIYLHAEEVSWLPQEFGEPLPPAPEEAYQNLVVPARPKVLEPSAGRVVTSPAAPDPTPPTQLALSARRFRGLVAEQLYRSAPESDARVGGQRVRGRWEPANVLDESGGVFLLGLLSEGLQAETSARLTSSLRRRGARLSEGRGRGWFGASVHDRVVVAYAPGRSGQPWDLLDDGR